MDIASNNHHRRSIRLKGYDYSQQGLYFITLCVQNRACLFGEIVNGTMVLNAFGEIAQHEWMETATIRKNVTLHAFVVMPNHFHAIVEITNNGGRGELHSPQMDSPQISGEFVSPVDADNCKGELYSPQLSGECNSPLSMGECNSHNSGECNSPLRGPSQTVGAIVRGYKSAVTKQMKSLGFDAVLWQRNYWEHIIRNQGEYERISTYIENNPTNWNNDTLKK